MEEAIHNVLCRWSVTSCSKEDLLEEVCDGLELIPVKLLHQHSLVYQITEKCAAVAGKTGVHQLTYLSESEMERWLCACAYVPMLHNRGKPEQAPPCTLYDCKRAVVMYVYM